MNAFLSLRLILPLLVLVLPLPGLAQTQLDAQALAPLERIAETEIASGHVPGAVVLVGQGTQVIYLRAFGYRAVHPIEDAMTTDTVFDLASLTKVVATTPSILRLVERGTLSLDTPVAHYWPKFAQHGKGAITVRQLLSHTSGLPAGIDVGQIRKHQDVLNRLAAVKPVVRAGGDPLYSDVNFAVLGELVHRVSNQPLNTFAARYIFEPLGMADTGFLPNEAKHMRIAPTNPDGSEWRRGKVHDPLASSLGGVSGNAGLFATATDLSRFAQALLAGGEGILQPTTVMAMFSPQTHLAASPLGLGWRINAPLASNRAALPPYGAASHLGYTGTGLWIDPVTGTYVVILTNRVHFDHGDAAPLRAKIIDAVAEAIGRLAPEQIVERRPELSARLTPYIPKTVAQPVWAGIDVLEAQTFASLDGMRIALLTNRSGVDAAGRRSIDVLFHAQNLQLKAIWSPEHGLGANHEGRIANDTDALTGLPVYSLYSKTRQPTEEMLAGLDAVVVDLQDVGARFYTYASTLALVMEAASKHSLKVVVLDRPNPLNGTTVQGPLLDLELRSFTGYWPLPVRHGLTLGEFARLFQGEASLALDLTVVPMQKYRRDMWYDETGLPWLPPSPNLTSLTATILYPGVGMIEGGEISVGRGTDHPFELVGAPWINGPQFAAELERLALPGVRFAVVEFEPVVSPYAGKRCYGVQLQVSDRDTLDTPALSLALATTLHHLYPQHFLLANTLGSIGNRATLDAMRANVSVREIVDDWHRSIDAFVTRRAPYLLYD
ncbi:exo-beta-N-acetylmuramidase NamZ domain-containing protein [Uliginosibacterium gangwonense]|uniref:exo-beta-N-acetylmuramidase NamZ domain-containing protein n=1 Tax=Uliginosibacterium gangwonense TaxID=392736 RepID=UPI00037976C0|nr:exo-beta-N-acetylmuramidase NamZ domain-containing protein [Uliginosibacterium gangwonense]